MSDWIDDLGKKDDDESNEERLRIRDRIIHAKAPEFWGTLVECVTADCEKLKARHPGRAGLQAHIAKQRGEYFLLEGKELPLRAVAVDLNVDGHFIKLVKSVRDELGTVSSATTERIRILVDSSGCLVFQAGDVEFRTPQDLAKRLFGFVLDLPD